MNNKDRAIAPRSRIVSFTISLLVVCALFGSLARLNAQSVAYTDEASFLQGLQAAGFVAIAESFEDDAVWGDVRTPATAESVTSQGVTWTASSPRNGITTGGGPARTGSWGFFSLPHGDYENGITDGFGGTGARPMVAVGGWIDTNSPPAKIGLFLDGDETHLVDFQGNTTISALSSFFGVIDPGGFHRFDFRELEGTIGDQKLIFADDFTFAFSGDILDCNENGVADAIDILDDTSRDCNGNGIPDECEIDRNSAAPNGPFFCIEGCAPDCNDNGVLDGCEVITPRTEVSAPLEVPGPGSSVSYTALVASPTQADAALLVTAFGNFGGPDEFLAIEVDGVSAGAVFASNGTDCPPGEPDSARIVLPRDLFNDVASDGEVTIALTSSAEVDPGECDQPSWIEVALTVFQPSEKDRDGDGVPDECRGDVHFRRGDCNDDGSVDISDASCMLNWLFLGSAAPRCAATTNTNGDVNADISDASYLLNHLFLGGAPPAPPFAACGASDLAADEALGCEESSEHCP